MSKHTFRNLMDSKQFYLGLISGLFVAIVSVLLNMLNKMFDPENKSLIINWISAFVLVVLFIWALGKWSGIVDVQDDIDVADLKRRRKI